MNRQWNEEAYVNPAQYRHAQANGPNAEPPPPDGDLQEVIARVTRAVSADIVANASADGRLRIRIRELQLIIVDDARTLQQLNVSGYLGGGT